MTTLEDIEALLQKLSRVQDLCLTKLVELERKSQAPTPPAPKPTPSPDLAEKAALLECPECGGEMKVRFRKSDGEPFFGCCDFPECKGILNANTKPSVRALAQAQRLATPIPRVPRSPEPKHISTIVDPSEPVPF